MRLIHKNHRGYTLVEVIVALAIIGFITAGIATTIFQVITIEASTSNHMTAVRQVQNAGYWISHDTQMSQDVDDNPTAPKVLEITWTEWGDGITHTVTYTLDSSELWRYYDGIKIPGVPVARHITQAIGSFTDGKLTFTVTATVEGWQPAIETRVYEVIPRPDEIYH